MSEADEIGMEDLEAAGDFYDSYTKQELARQEKRKVMLEKFAETKYCYLGAFTRAFNLEPKNGIVFQETAMARLMHTVGWLHGLKDAGNKNADNLTIDFLEAITRHSLVREERPDMFQEFKGWDTWKYPKQVILFGDDGTFGGFGFVLTELYGLDKPDSTYSYEVEIMGTRLYTVRIYNGGLLYHGPKGSEVFSVNIGTDNRKWCYHT